jgi:hypothetical protein
VYASDGHISRSIQLLNCSLNSSEDWGRTSSNTNIAEIAKVLHDAAYCLPGTAPRVLSIGKALLVCFED